MSKSSKSSVLVGLVGLLLLGGCAGANRSLISDPRGYEEGLVVHYSDRLHGRRTASGEIYDRRAYTAAHRYLPFGTVVRVTKLSDGRSVEVRINDRGPNDDCRRIIDVSMAAARKLGIVQQGKARARVEVVSAAGERQDAGTASSSGECCPCAAAGG